MSLPERITFFEKRPMACVTKYDFDNVCSFLSGYDHGTDRQFLKGFREWLISQNPDASNMWWPKLVLYIAFPDADCSFENCLEKEGGTERAVAKLFELLKAYKLDESAT